MTKKELYLVAAKVKEALDFVTESKSVPVERCSCREGIYNVANNLWYDLVCFNDQHRKWFPDNDDWFRACGFREWKEAIE